MSGMHIVLNGENSEEKLECLTKQLEQGIIDVFNSDTYKRYLSVMSRFHSYSYRNCLLIAMQKPDATLVKGYKSWENDKEIGRKVKPEERKNHIKIILGYNKKGYKYQDKINPDTNKPFLDSNGKPIKEKVKFYYPKYKVGYVYDVSQTEGKELPSLGVKELNGEVINYDIFLQALKRVSPVPIEFEDIGTNARGYYHLIDKRIVIQSGMSELQTLKTAIHEITHARLHDKDKLQDQQDQPDQVTKEVQAESSAFVICKYFGLDTSDYSFGYIAGWSHDKDLEVLKQSLSVISDNSTEMIDNIIVVMDNLVKDKIKSMSMRINDLFETNDPYNYRADNKNENIKAIEKQLLEFNDKNCNEIMKQLDEISIQKSDIELSRLTEEISSVCELHQNLSKVKSIKGNNKDKYHQVKEKEDFAR